MTTKGSAVLVTGGSGLIGSAVIRELSERYTVIGFDREGNPHPPPMAECVCVDLTSSESVRAAFERVRYAYGDRLASVVHLAAYYDFSGEPSSKYEEITVRGTERLLKELRNFQVEQFLFSSTMLVHAPSARAPYQRGLAYYTKMGLSQVEGRNGGANPGTAW
ncbi:MAG: NAD(P)-dependent oxidoreductase [Bryobacteraceae bacterium]|nr:NAD(P)-dependent oxidoreductase [Bryobacteraceae bacterium]